MDPVTAMVTSVRPSVVSRPDGALACVPGADYKARQHSGCGRSGSVTTDAGDIRWPAPTRRRQSAPRVSSSRRRYSGQPFPGEPYPVPAGYPGPLPPPVGLPAAARRWPCGCGGRCWRAGRHRGAGRRGALLGGGRASPPVRRRSPTRPPRPRSRTISPHCRTATPRPLRGTTLCGMFDAIKDRKSDLALARLASDAFRKQFSRAEVISIDEIVLSSSYQAQVLFTMRVAPGSNSRSAPRTRTGRGADTAPGRPDCWCARICYGPAASTESLTADGGGSQLNESPQAQEPVAFGLSIVKPCFSMVSTKSIVAPCT